MCNRLPTRRQQAIGSVGVEIAGEQHRLKEEHARRPHRRRPAKQRQNQLGEHRLHQEQQQRVHEQGRGEQRHRSGRARRELVAGAAAQDGGG
jgi:hypothetical protein